MADFLLLTPGWIRVARGIGTARYNDARGWGVEPRNGYDGPVAVDESDMQAAGAELASHLMLYVPWTGMELGVKNPPDIGDFIEVRHTPRENGRLIVHPPHGPKPTDDPDRACLLVTGTLEAGYTMRGWLWAEEAQAMGEHWRENVQRPCFMIPQSLLHPVSLLRDIIRCWR